MLASRQRLEVRGLQVHHGGALFSGVVGLGKGLAVHLDTLEGAERRGGTEHQAVVAAGIVCGRLVGAVQLSGDAGGGGVVIVAAGGLGGDGVGRVTLLDFLRSVDRYFTLTGVFNGHAGVNTGQLYITILNDDGLYAFSGRCRLDIIRTIVVYGLTRLISHFCHRQISIRSRPTCIAFCNRHIIIVAACQLQLTLRRTLAPIDGRYRRSVGLYSITINYRLNHNTTSFSVRLRTGYSRCTKQSACLVARTPGRCHFIHSSRGIQHLHQRPSVASSMTYQRTNRAFTCQCAAAYRAPRELDCLEHRSITAAITSRISDKTTRPMSAFHMRIYQMAI